MATNTTLHADRLPGIRSSTAVLFGLAVADLRRVVERTPSQMVEADLVSPNGESFTKTVEWWSAVERGEVIPNSELVDQLEFFFKAVGLEEGGGLRDVLRNLELDPFGDAAQHLRETYGVDPSFDELDWSPASFGGSLTPIADEIDGRDRFLVLAPIAVGFAIGKVLVDIDRWIWTGDYESDVVGSAVIVGSLVGLSAFFVGVLDRLLDEIASSVRFGVKAETHEDFHALRESNGLQEQRGRWWVAGDLRHLLAANRPRYRSACLWSDFSERFAALLVVLAMTQIGFGVVALSSGKTPEVLATVAAFLLLSLLVQSVLRSRDRWVKTARKELQHGLGYR